MLGLTRLRFRAVVLRAMDFVAEFLFGLTLCICAFAAAGTAGLGERDSLMLVLWLLILVQVAEPLELLRNKARLGRWFRGLTHGAIIGALALAGLWVILSGLPLVADGSLAMARCEATLGGVWRCDRF